MLEYAFGKIQRKQDLMLCAVLAKDTERVLIGTKKEIQSVLFEQKEEQPEVLVDITRQYGSIIVEFERDDKREWETVLGLMDRAHAIMLHKKVRTDIFRRSEVIETENTIRNILKKKYDSQDPICQYVAIKLWEAYWYVRGKGDAEYEKFSEKAHNIIRPFTSGLDIEPEVNTKLYKDNSVYRWVEPKLDCDNEYPRFFKNNKEGNPYIFVNWSLIPLMRFYASNAEEGRYTIIKCGICGKLFIMPTLHNKYCSDLCKRRAAEINKQKRFKDEVLKKQDSISRNAYESWSYVLKCAKKSGKYTQEQIAEMEDMVLDFRKEKNNLAKQCRKKTLDLRVLQNTTAERSRDLDKLIADMASSEQ